MREIIEKQREAFRGIRTLPVEWRNQQLESLHVSIEAHEEEILAALKADLGKGEVEAYASEVAHILGDIRHAQKHLKRWAAGRNWRSPWMVWPARSQVVPEPYGVALIIGPWNYPFQLLMSPLVSAIAAGNCVVLKPSEHAPRTAVVLSKVIKGAFDPSEVAVVEGGVEVAQALLREKFDKIFFTGGTAVGREVLKAAAANLTPVTLELGGKSPCVVAADADLEVAARRIAWGKFMNAGQTCVAPDHVWVDRAVSQAFVDTLKRVIEDFYGRNPQRSPDYGRIVNDRHLQRLQAYLADGVVACGGVVDAADRYIAPTVLTGVPLDAPVMQEEIFGPILPVIEYGDIDEVVVELEARPVPLAFYLFTRDRKFENGLIGRVRSGGVCVNDTISHLLDRRLPFGGLGESGMGACHGKAGFDAFSHQRAVMRRGCGFDPDFRYPPVKLGIAKLRAVLRWFG